MKSTTNCNNHIHAVVTVHDVLAAKCVHDVVAVIN